MIKDPKPFLWTPITSFNGTKRSCKNRNCLYSTRYTLFCDTNRLECKNCYMKQQAMTDAQMLQWNKDIVFHVCDRCGRNIALVDKIVYLGLEDRKGKQLANLELCGFCISELVDWINNEEPEEE